MGLGRLRIFATLFKSKIQKTGSSGNSDSVSTDSLLRRIGYRFRNEKLLRQALTHRSCFNSSDEHWHSNERLELLGDAVLGLVVTESLYRQYSHKSEGELTRLKSLLVSREVLAREAENIELGSFLILGNGEEQSGGRNRRSILADTIEALIGAVYLDGGLKPVRRVILEKLYRDMNRLLHIEAGGNYKSMLLEFTQGEGRGAPKYRVVEESGPEHQKTFTIEVWVKGEMLGTGRGASKKKAEQEAAWAAVKSLGLNVGDLNI